MLQGLNQISWWLWWTECNFLVTCISVKYPRKILYLGVIHRSFTNWLICSTPSHSLSATHFVICPFTSQSAIHSSGSQLFTPVSLIYSPLSFCDSGYLVILFLFIHCSVIQVIASQSFSGFSQLVIRSQFVIHSLVIYSLLSHSVIHRSISYSLLLLTHELFILQALISQCASYSSWSFSGITQ
jgi:hypothetical protein